MFRELVQYGEELERKGKLPPVGFYSYSEPIYWVVHLRKEGSYIEKTELDIERPYCGRTVSIEAHLLVDEAGYVFGLPENKSGNNDSKKHLSFIELTRKFLKSDTLKSSELRQAVELMLKVLESKTLHSDPRFKDIEPKHWISFQTTFDPLSEKHLFEHEEARQFWLEEMQRRTGNKPPVCGECATCGEHKQLIRRIPLPVKLLGRPAPLHSLNKNAFVSHQSSSKDAYIGVCFKCADTASRAFNYLSNSEQHKRILVFNSKNGEGLENQFALFWASTPEVKAQIEINEETFEFDDLVAGLALAIANEHPIKGKPKAEIAQLAQLLDANWKIKDGILNLSDIGFNLGILSPNVGRIALREWISVSIEQLKSHYANYLKATRIISSEGDEFRSFSVADLIHAVASSNPNLSRALLRTLMLGNNPPHILLNAALVKFSNPHVFNDHKAKNPLDCFKARQRQQQLISSIKLCLFFKQEEDMSELNPNHRTQAYLCGRLLAILEEAQQRASGFGLNTTLVDRFYGAASTAPGTVFGNLIRLSTTGHLPKIGKEVNEQIETVIADLDNAGGFPKILTQLEQAEFALGFYHQRASYRANRKSKQSTTPIQSAQGGSQ
ncbi:MAG: type I-C CRISPR-associated protein Cas8c/Csd1 [Deinococcaceae bacterium]